MPRLRLPARARVTPRLATRARHSALESRASRHRDDMSSRSIVVVGAGNAAGYLVRALVSHGLGKNVTLIGAEDVAPYERPALTKVSARAKPSAFARLSHVRRRRR